uniref:Zinc finger protein 385D n=1 Tax=Amphiprion percula TaxID=161767 RepID=A0A3P8U424_AMPPE
MLFLHLYFSVSSSSWIMCKVCQLSMFDLYFWLRRLSLLLCALHHVAFALPPTGNTCQNGLMPALVRPTLPAVQTSLGMKQFIPIPLDSASAVSLFPGFNTMDPVQKAVLHHTLGLPPTAKRKHVSCSVCQLRFNSQSQALAHYKGTKHAKKLKALDTPKSKLKGSAVAKETTNQENAKGINTSMDSAARFCSESTDKHKPPLPAQPLASLATPTTPTPAPVASLMVPSSTAATAPDTTSAAGGDERPSKLGSPSEPDLEPEAEPETDTETEEEKARRLLYCSLCKVAVNSASQLEAHNSGTKHKTMLEARSGVGSIKSFPRAGVKSKLATSSKSSTGLQNKTFYCETCDVHVNSETQLKQHISSRRHKDRAAGKPAKPKYSPYSKPAQIIPAHLAAVAAAAAAISNSFPHRTNHATNHTPTPALFQTQSLPAALLRPAPGPIRTSHPQVLFAPY